MIAFIIFIILGFCRLNSNCNTWIGLVFWCCLSLFMANASKNISRPWYIITKCRQREKTFNFLIAAMLCERFNVANQKSILRWHRYKIRSLLICIWNVTSFHFCMSFCLRQLFYSGDLKEIWVDGNWTFFINFDIFLHLNILPYLTMKKQYCLVLDIYVDSL